MSTLRIILLLAAACAVAFCYKVYSAGAAVRDSSPRIATLDFYGTHRLTHAQLNAKLGLRVGDPAPVFILNDPDLFARIARPLFGIRTKASLESALREIPGVRDAFVAVVQEGNPRLRSVFVGVSESSAPATPRSFHGNSVLPESVPGLYDRHWRAFFAATQNPAPDFDEDDSKGYALFNDPAMLALEKQAIAFVQAPQNRAAALTVLQTSPAVDQRRAAAWLLSYGPDPQQTAADLAAALDDPDDDVRNTACRELAIIATSLKLSTPPAPIVQMLNSVIWTDRDKAMAVLAPLTAPDSANAAETLLEMKRNGLASLTEMAHWHAAPYARMARVLLDRIHNPTK